MGFFFFYIVTISFPFKKHLLSQNLEGLKRPQTMKQMKPLLKWNKTKLNWRGVCGKCSSPDLINRLTLLLLLLFYLEKVKSI